MDFLKWTAYELEEAPTSYGFLHILFLVLTVSILAFLIWKIKKINNKKLDKMVFIFGIILLVIEVYKQIIYTYVHNDGSYQWYAFPFQFCSTPMYVCLLLPFIKNENIKEAMYGYIAIFGSIAGIMVMIYPEDVFIRTLSICLQSMIWHSSMVILGIFILVKKYDASKIKSVVSSLVVFGIFVILAQIMNITFYHAFIKDLDQTFNMFFISPYFECTLPVFSIIYEKTNWFLCFVSYLIAFSLGGVIVHYVVRTVKMKKLIKT